MASATAQSGGARGRWAIVALIAFFTVLTVLFTYPLSTSPDSYLSHLTDPRQVTWSLAWNAHALISNPVGIFHPNIYFPDPAPKASSETFLLPSVLVAPVNWAGHPVLAYNLVLLSSLVLSGLGAALWVRYMTGSWGAGVIAGMIWAFAPGKFHQISHLHMMLGQWIPFALLYCGKYLESGRPRHLYAMSLFAGVQFGFSMHYGVFLVPFLGLYALGLLVLLPHSAVRANLTDLRRQMLVAALVFVALAVAVGLPYLRTQNETDLRRGYNEILLLSGEPNSFLSSTPQHRAPHVAWLDERYHENDASYFVGLVPLALLGFALVLWGRGSPEGPTAPDDASDGTEEEPTPAQRVPAPLRARVHLLAVGVAGVAFGFHLLGLLAAWSASGGWAAWVVSTSVAVHPALVAGIAVVAAMLTMPTAAPETPRSAVYLSVLGYLTVITYLLAYGPEVQAFEARLGCGPYWLLYRFLLPFQIIRSAGRIGLLWILSVAALAGFAFAHLERRWNTARPAPGGVPRAQVALALLLAVMVWEFRTWPVEHFPADPAADPADVWLAQQPGDFALVHAPIGSGADGAPQETAYMLGSTLHWKNMVNGYLRFAPIAYRELADTPQLGTEFFRQLRAGFPVRYMLVHQDRLADARQWDETRRLLRGEEGAAFLAQFDHTLLFDLSGEGPAEFAAREGDFGFEFALPFPAAQAGLPVGFSLRGMQRHQPEAVVALVGWGVPVRAVAVSPEWRQVELVTPEDLVVPGEEVAAAARGPEIPLVIEGHTLQPVGDTGAEVITGFTIEASRSGMVLGVGARVLHRARNPAYTVHHLSAYGGVSVRSRRFMPQGRGPRQMLDHVRRIPDGELVAISVQLADFAALDADVVEALRLIGATAPEDEQSLLMAVLGRRGAPPGAALQMAHHTRAFIDIEGATPVLQLRDVALR